MKRMIVLAALCTAATLSFAQVEAPSNLTFRLGFVLPIDSSLRDAAKSFIGVGLDFYPNFTLVKGSESVLSLDWIGKSGSGSKGNIFPIMFNQKFNSGSGDVKSKSYFFVGAGVAFIDVTSQSTVLAARLGFGAELGSHLIGETALYYSDAVDGVHITSLGFYLGYRF